MKIKDKILMKVNDYDLVDDAFIVPDDVVAIAADAFKGSRVHKVKIPNNLVAIGDQAFADCYFLREIEMPETVNYIGKYVFYGCHELKLNMKSSLFSINMDYFPTTFSVKKLIINNKLIYERTWDFENKKLHNIELFQDIRKKELNNKIKELLKQKHIKFRRFYSDNDVNSFIDCIIKKMDMKKFHGYNYVDDLNNYINKCSFNNVIIRNSQINNELVTKNKSNEEVYNDILKYKITSLESKEINEIMHFGDELNIYPNYVAGNFLNIMSKKMDDNIEIKKLIVLLNSITSKEERKNIFGKIFFKKSLIDNNVFNLNIDILNQINSFIQTNLQSLYSEIKTFELLKKIIKVYIKKINKEIKNLDNLTLFVDVSDQEDILLQSDNNVTNDLINSKINNLKISNGTMLDQYQKINTVLTFDLIIIEKLNNVINNVLPNVISEVAMNNGMIQRKEIFDEIRGIENILNDMILDNNSKKQKIDIEQSDKLSELGVKINEIFEEQKVLVKSVKK